MKRGSSFPIFAAPRRSSAGVGVRRSPSYSASRTAYRFPAASASFSSRISNPDSARYARSLSGWDMGQRISRTPGLRVYSDSPTIRAISSPPMPQTRISVIPRFSGSSPDSPSQSTKSIRSENPAAAAFFFALSRGARLMSEATAKRILPAESSQRGRWAWSVPISATTAFSRTKEAAAASLPSSAGRKRFAGERGE